MSFEHELRSLLEKHASDIVEPEGAFCTGFVLFAEYIDANNEFYTFSLKDSNAPLWRLLGLVDYLRENELNATEEEDDL
jgi:hypothetical protein